MTQLDSAVASLLGLDPAKTSVSGQGGGMSFASKFKITTKRDDGSTEEYFMKTGPGPEAETMFAGEHASLNALHAAVPTLCPQSHGHGACADAAGRAFLVTDYLRISGRLSDKASRGGMLLVQKLARLHTQPAPTPEGYDEPQFGFPVTTCCGDTPQDNAFTASWADFYANRRLRAVVARAIESNGEDPELDALVEWTCTTVVPRLLGDDHLNAGQGVTPVLVHGDLWCGNAALGRLPGMKEPQDVVFDSSACYAHSEFELGLMEMFGGFGRHFARDYHLLVPKTRPVDEYEDRIALYELYHQLNHHALSSGGYRTGAVRIMERLLSKYGSSETLQVE